MLGRNRFSPIHEEELDLPGALAKDWEHWKSLPLAFDVDGYTPNLLEMFQPSELFAADSLYQQCLPSNPTVKDDYLSQVMAKTEEEPGNLPNMWPQLQLFDFYNMDFQTGSESFPLFGGGIFANDLLEDQLDNSLLGECLLPELSSSPPLLFSESARESGICYEKESFNKQIETVVEQGGPQALKPEKTLKAEKPSVRRRGKRSRTASSDQPVRRSPRLAGRGK